MDLINILGTLVFVGIVSAAAVWRVKHDARRLGLRGDMDLFDHELVLKRARQRAMNRGSVMIEPPRNLARKVYDNDRRAIGEALAERRLDDAIALYCDAARCTQFTANRVINRWMAEGRRVNVTPDPAALPGTETFPPLPGTEIFPPLPGTETFPTTSRAETFPTTSGTQPDPVRDRPPAGADSPWPTLPERNQGRFHSGE